MLPRMFGGTIQYSFAPMHTGTLSLVIGPVVGVKILTRFESNEQTSDPDCGLVSLLTVCMYAECFSVSRSLSPQCTGTLVA